ncbi:MAG: DsbA family protein [Paracoccaceae bacterium]
MPLLDRRTLLALAAVLPTAFALPAAGQETEAAPETETEDRKVVGDVILGDPNAPVTVIEYASFTCPHCASFHVRTLPEVKANYIDTGQVQFILREVYFDPFGLWASMIARCGGEEAFYPIADQLLEKQREWTAKVEDPEAVAEDLRKIGRLNGLSSAESKACLEDRPFAEALIADYQENSAADNIRSTPSFVINGELHTGDMRYDEFSALLDRYLEGI